VFRGRVHPEALVGHAAEDEADAAAYEADAAEQAHDINKPVNEADEAVVGAHAEEAQESGDKENDGAAHEHVQAEVEGVGPVPQRAVIVERGFEEEHFHEQGLEVAHVIHMMFLRPPVAFFHVAAAMLGAGAFMRNGIDFPAAVKRSGLYILFDFEKRRDCKSDHAEIPQEVKQCSHACSPVFRCACTRISA